MPTYSCSKCGKTAPYPAWHACPSVPGAIRLMAESAPGPDLPPVRTAVLTIHNENGGWRAWVKPAKGATAEVSAPALGSLFDKIKSLLDDETPSGNLS